MFTAPRRQTILCSCRLVDPDNDLSELGIIGTGVQGRIRLAAAGAMLRLARRHDLAFPAQNYVVRPELPRHAAPPASPGWPLVQVVAP